MSEISRDDLNRLYDGINDVREAVTASEVRLGAQINAQRVENDAKFIRAADLKVVEGEIKAVDTKVDTLAGVVNTELGKRNWNKQTLILVGLTFLANLLILILGATGVFHR